MAEIDLLARHQVVKGTDAIPRAPCPEALVDENLLDACVVVFRCSRSVLRLQLGVEVLHPLALTDRIEDEDDIAQACQSLAEGLIGLDGLAVIRMPAGRYDTRKREVSTFRNVEVRRHEKSRPAFEEDVLDCVCVALDDLRHTGIERRLFRKRTERLADLSTDRPDIVLGVSPRRQGSDSLYPLLVYLVLTPDKELLHHARETVEREKRGGRCRCPTGLHRVRGQVTGQRGAGAAERQRAEHPAARDARGADGHVHPGDSWPEST